MRRLAGLGVGVGRGGRSGRKNPNHLRAWPRGAVARERYRHGHGQGHGRLEADQRLGAGVARLAMADLVTKLARQHALDICAVAKQGKA